MPGWHEFTRDFANRVQVAGIIQEQHPERTRLFMQWKQMEWPIMVDALNLLGLEAVPITLFVDEFGIIRAVNPRHEELESFLETEYPAPSPLPEARETPNREDLRRRLDEPGVTLSARAEGLYLWGNEADLSEAISTFEKLLEKEPENGAAHFRLGVAFRSRFDSARGPASDFGHAVSHWKTALDIDPNQYIWRRRIQQYGPRLDKPYSFYDWIHQARSEIESRGETPLPLTIEPGGAEFAYPEEELSTLDEGTAEPDPEGRIYRDESALVRAEATVVPHTGAGSHAARVHVLFAPDQAQKAHWNNEAGNMVFWMEAPSGWAVDPQRIEIEVPPQPVSREVRRVEFEVGLPEEDPVDATLHGYALYYVCEDVDGTCLYRRLDVPIDLSSLVSE